MNLYELAHFSVLAFGSLFVIVDPIATVPAFLAMTPRDTPAQRIHTARLASVVMAVVLLVFAVAGKIIFKFLGITMPAFQIAASIVLLIVALDMLRAQRSRVQETSEETTAGAEKSDIAITPLAVPMLAGPGAISTAIVLQSQAVGVAQYVALCVCIVSVALVELPHLPHLGAGRRVVEFHRDEGADAHHGPAAGRGGDSVHDKRIERRAGRLAATLVRSRVISLFKSRLAGWNSLANAEATRSW